MTYLNPSVLTPNNLKGIAWALLAAAFFALAAVMAKVAVKEYHVLQILFFRQIVVFLSTLPFLVNRFPEGIKTQQPLAHVYRLLGSFIALSCGIWAVSVLPLTTAITLGFAQVFFIGLLAMVVLNEAVGLNRFAAIVTGLVGVVVVMRPGVAGIVDVHAIIPLLGAMGGAVAIVSVRKLSQQESTATLLVYQAVFVGALAGIPLFWLWVTPTTSGWWFLLAMGVAAAAGQWAGVKALRLGEASVIGNIQYVQLIYATVLGFYVFSEVPDRYTAIGAIIIIGSSLYLVHREAVARQQRKNDAELR